VSGFAEEGVERGIKKMGYIINTTVKNITIHYRNNMTIKISLEYI
jgi:hypothetical protein